ncbi:MAG: hypothetical protein WCO13_01990 [Bacteroidota bacterium]
MNYFIEKKSAFWTIVILVVLNVFTLSMIWILRPPHPFPLHARHEKLIPDLVIAELKLDGKQAILFKESEIQQMRKINLLLDSLHQSKQELFLSSFDQAIDTLKMESLIHQIGSLNEEIDRISFSHIIELKHICNTHQKEILEDFFWDMGRLGHRPPAERP